MFMYIDKNLYKCLTKRQSENKYIQNWSSIFGIFYFFQ